MAYISFQPHDHFDIPQWAGSNSTTTVSGMEFKPDVIWIKRYDGNGHPVFTDSSYGTGYNWVPSGNNANVTTVHVASYTADGFTLTGNINDSNDASQNYLAACFKSGGDSPAITYAVKVVSDGGNKYRFDDFGSSTVTLELQEGGVYTFDQSDSSNSGHPLRFSTTSNGSHGGGSEYTTGVVVSGTPGNAGAKTVITVAASAPVLYYYCTAHSGMGGTANTNAVRGSSNFAGSIHSQVSANTTSGVSVVKYVGTGAAATIGHGLSVAPRFILLKNTAIADRGTTLNMSTMFVSDPETDNMQFAISSATLADQDIKWNDTAPTTSVFSVGSSNMVSGSSQAHVAYCFAEVPGFSNFGYYAGNNNTNGTYVYTGFRPKYVLIKNTEADEDWVTKLVGLPDYGLGGESKRSIKYNTNAPSTNCTINYHSNGFQIATTDGKANGDGVKYFYIAFADMPVVGSNGVPSLAI